MHINEDWERMMFLDSMYKLEEQMDKDELFQEEIKEEEIRRLPALIRTFKLQEDAIKNKPFTLFGDN